MPIHSLPSKLIVAFLFTITLLITGCSDSSDSEKPAASEHHLERGKAYLKQGRYQSSVIEAKNIIKQNPNEAKGYVFLASVYNQLGQGGIALDILDKPFEGKETADYLLVLGNAYFLKGKTQSLSSLLKNNAQLANSHPEEYYLLQVKNAMRKRDREKVQSYLETLLQQSPDSIEGQLLYADHLITMKKDEGITLLDTLAKKHSDNPRVLFTRAKLAYQSGDLETTEKLLNETLSILPNTDMMTPLHAETLRVLSQLLTRQGRHNESLRYEKILSDAFPGANEIENNYENAIIEYRKGNVGAAKKSLESLLKKHPRHEPSRQLLGIIKYSEGDLSKASELFSTVDPETASAATKQAYALTNIRLNKPEKVLELLKTDIENTTNADLLTLYGTAAIASPKHSEKGVAALEKALTIDPKRARVYLLLNRHYNQQNDAEKALANVEKALKIAPKDPYIQAAIVQQYTVMGQTEKATGVIRTVLKQQPNDLATNLLAGDYYINKELPKQALAYYKKALTLKPGHIASAIGVARSHTRLSQWDDAQAIAKMLIEKYPNNRVGFETTLSIFKQQNTVEDGLASLKEMNSAYSLATVSAYYARNRDYQQASEAYQKALKLDPNNSSLMQLGVELAFGQARQEINAQAFDKARTTLAGGLENNPNNLQLLILKAQLEMNSGDVDKATEVIASISQLDSGIGAELSADSLSAQQKPEQAMRAYFELWQTRPSDNLGTKIYRLLGQSGNTKGAQTFLNNWMKKDPDSVMALNLYSNQLLTTNQYQQAIPPLEQVIRKEPNSAIALNNLAWAYLQVGDKKELAEQTAKRAYELAPENADIVDTYGWILHQLGQSEKALPLLEKAHALNPEKAEIKKHLDTVKGSQ